MMLICGGFGGYVADYFAHCQPQGALCNSACSLKSSESEHAIFRYVQTFYDQKERFKIIMMVLCGWQTGTHTRQNDNCNIVTFEAADVGTSSAWFYWTLKMEGGAFAEWDFLRGIEEGWFPPLPDDPQQPSQSVFGSCLEIMFRTDDNVTIITEFPDPTYMPPLTDPHKIVDDDVVISHGDSLLHANNNGRKYRSMRSFWYHPWQQVLLGALLVMAVVAIHKFKNRKRANYSQLNVEITACV